ncbi:unnamed protein product [Lepidochelys kempii]
MGGAAVRTYSPRVRARPYGGGAPLKTDPCVWPGGKEKEMRMGRLTQRSSQATEDETARSIASGLRAWGAPSPRKEEPWGQLQLRTRHPDHYTGLGRSGAAPGWTPK